LSESDEDIDEQELNLRQKEISARNLSGSVIGNAR